APAASLFSAGYQQYLGTTLFWDNAGDIETDYASARNNHAIDLGTNSIGSNTAANNYDCNIHGDYGTTSALLDGIVRGDNATVGSPVMMTWANGNERGGGSPTGRCGSNFHTTAPPSCAKNPIHVGATNSDGDSMTSFSSWGPCDDGRLKPIISGPGCESGYVNNEYAIYSTDLSSSYSLKCGTSMATPAVAGAATLGIEHYRDVTGNPNARPSNALMKAWLIHTVRDQGVAGPDYSYGYGQVDTLKLINLISDTTTYRGDTIAAHGEVDSFSYVIPANTGQFKVSLAWDDYAASPIISNGAAALVNNLDLEVIAPNGSTTYYPFSLDPANPERAATSSGANSLDNQEQVIIDSPTPGTWTIKVKGTSVPQAAQPYALVHTHAGTLNCGADLVTNGGFESGSTGWALSGSPTAATVVTAPAGGSGNAMLIGGNAGSNYQEYGYRTVTIPANATIAKLSFDWFMSTSESSATVPADYFLFLAYRTDFGGALLAGDLRTNAWKPNVWHNNDYVDLSQLAGQTFNLFFWSINNASAQTSFYVDNVSLVTCTENEAPQAAELALAKTAAASVVSGQPLTYTLWLTNSSSVAATGVTITDTVPAHSSLSLASLSGDASAGGTTPGSLITWSLAADLAAGQSVSRTFVVNVNSGLSGGTISNTAAAVADNAASVSSNSVNTSIIEAAALSLSKAAPAAVSPGNPLTYTLW
ncbi:MAG: S8 family serine peptidase, partial [Anaerolineae bacterium]|nr:S8 family serine peptidase [Anaerolineae bacterium]